MIRGRTKKKNQTWHGDDDGVVEKNVWMLSLSVFYVRLHGDYGTVSRMVCLNEYEVRMECISV